MSEAAGEPLEPSVSLRADALRLGASSEHAGYVLLLGASDTMRGFMQRWMRAGGYRVIEVATPLEAIQELQDERRQIEAVFVAGPLAGASVADLREFLEGEYPGVRVVAT